MAGSFASASAPTSLHVLLPCPALIAPPRPPPACSGARRGGSSSGGGASSSHHFEFSLLLMPRRSQVAERILEERGILGDVAIRWVGGLLLHFWGAAGGRCGVVTAYAGLAQVCMCGVGWDLPSLALSSIQCLSLPLTRGLSAVCCIGLSRDLPLDWVPLDEDLLSLELPSAFKVGCVGWANPGVSRRGIYFCTVTRTAVAGGVQAAAAASCMQPPLPLLLAPHLHRSVPQPHCRS